MCVGALLALVGIVSLHAVTARVDADASGLRRRTLLRRRDMPWSDVADLRVRLKYANTSRVQEIRRVSLVPRDGREQLLPLPRSWSLDDPDFDTKLTALRALHRRHGLPESSHVTVISYRTAGRGWSGSLSLCVLLLAGAVVAAWFVPHTASQQREWRSAALGGGGPPAVTPHPGPERFAAKPIPVERLTVRNVRRPRGSDGDTVPRNWHIAELDDAGTLIRLAAAPDDLTRILRELGPALPSSRATTPPGGRRRPSRS